MSKNDQYVKPLSHLNKQLNPNSLPQIKQELIAAPNSKSKQSDSTSTAILTLNSTS